MHEKISTKEKTPHGIADSGITLLVGKLTWDAINDPQFGSLSDRTHSRWGRRKPYMLRSAIPFGLTIWLLYSVPPRLTGLSAFPRVSVASSDMVNSPHKLATQWHGAATGAVIRKSFGAVILIFN